MKLKLLLFSLLVSFSVAKAQDTITSLIFTEVRMDENFHTYVEITNMGTKPVDLSQFELGTITPWDDKWVPNSRYRSMLPVKDLDPGESFVVANFYDYTLEHSFVDPERFSPLTKKEMWELADMQIHLNENGEYGDSVSYGYGTIESWSGRSCYFLRQHLNETDSVVVDAVNCLFDQSDGMRKSTGPSDVAGVKDATLHHILVRKANITHGSTDWLSQRGIDISDSEWLPIPRLASHWEPTRKEFWTVGNHGNFKLDPLFFTSKTVTIDWANSTMTVPWGVRNDDNIMDEFNKIGGIAWHYDYSANSEDSAFVSVRTGDVLTIYACGNTLQTTKFNLIASEPTENDKLVIPKNQHNPAGGWNGASYDVTVKMPGMDSILDVPYATRIDTLLKYLEKPSIATWEVVFVDGVARPDLKLGDILKVTAKNGTTKDYYHY